jgi:hypothetical protein
MIVDDKPVVHTHIPVLEGPSHQRSPLSTDKISYALR